MEGGDTAMMMELVRVVKRRKASHDLGWTATDRDTCRLHGVGSHASGFYAMLVLISGIDAHGPRAADAVPN